MPFLDSKQNSKDCFRAVLENAFEFMTHEKLFALITSSSKIVVPAGEQ